MLPTARAGVLTWNRRPQAMPGRGPRTCGRGPRVALVQAAPGRACWPSPRAPGPGTLGGADRWPSPAGAGWRPEPLQGSECSSFAPIVSPWNSEELGSPAGPSLGEPGRRRPGGPNRTEGQNVQVSLRTSVGGTQDDLGPPAGPGRIPGRRFALSTRRDILAIFGSN